MRIPKMLNGVLSKHARASGERLGSPQLMSLSSVKQLLLALLDSHEQRGGVSADHYCETPHYHPMAEGKSFSRSRQVIAQASYRTAN